MSQHWKQKIAITAASHTHKDATGTTITLRPSTLWDIVNFLDQPGNTMEMAVLRMRVHHSANPHWINAVLRIAMQVQTLYAQWRETDEAKNAEKSERGRGYDKWPDVQPMTLPPVDVEYVPVPDKATATESELRGALFKIRPPDAYVKKIVPIPW